MMKDSRFRYEVPINKCFGIFHWDDADSILDVGYKTKKETNGVNHASRPANTIIYYRNVILFLPVLVANESSRQLDIMAGVTLQLAHSCSAFFDHVQKHLRQLRVLVQVDQVRKTIVYFECHPCFLETRRKQNHFISVIRYVIEMFII